MSARSGEVRAPGAPNAACQEVGYASELMVLEGKREKTDCEFLFHRLKEFSSVKLCRPALREGFANPLNLREAIKSRKKSQQRKAN